jgi:hypothetical protein
MSRAIEGSGSTYVSLPLSLTVLTLSIFFFRLEWQRRCSQTVSEFVSFLSPFLRSLSSLSYLACGIAVARPSLCVLFSLFRYNGKWRSKM